MCSSVMAMNSTLASGAAAGVKKSGALVAKLIAMLEAIIPPRIFMAFGAEL